MTAGRTLSGRPLATAGPGSFVPIGDVERVGAEGGRTRWRTTGFDPRFAFALGERQVCGGWYEFDSGMECEQGLPVTPLLYPDYGGGIKEESRIELPFLQDPRVAELGVVRFVAPLHGLRFDPSVASLEFSLGPGRLRRIGRVRAATRMVRALLRLAPDAAARRQLLRDIVMRLRTGGPSAMAEWLYRRYAESTSQPPGADESYQHWISLYDGPGPADPVLLARQGPLVSVLLPVFNPPERWLRRCLDSVVAQTWPHWELCVVDDASTRPYVSRVLAEYATLDARIRVQRRADNGHISATSNDCLAMARGEYVALLDHDDEMPPYALAEVVSAFERNPHWKLAYSDEDKIDEEGRRFDPYFKPDWNYDLLLAQNCVSHLGIYRTALVRDVGGFRPGFEGSQDWDLALRCVERLKPGEVGHIPRVLYHWRAIAGSTALGVGEKGYAAVAGERAVREHLARAGVEAEVESLSNGHLVVRRRLPAEPPRVSLIVPTRDHVDLLRTCIDSVLARTAYPDIEILVVDNQSADPDTLAYLDAIAADRRVRVLRYDAPFNYSAINNFAARQATGSVLGLLNNDIEATSPHWLSEMVSHVLRPDVGAVGAMLLYPDGSIQHAGVILGMHGVAGHMYARKPIDYPGQMGRARLAQELSAVTAACLLVRKGVFDEVGGLDEQLRVAFNDVDFCLRVKAAGYRNIWTPHAVLYHHESASRGYEDTPEKQARFGGEITLMRERWGEALQDDPAYNPNLSLTAEAFALSFPPRRR